MEKGNRGDKRNLPSSKEEKSPITSERDGYFAKKGNEKKRIKCPREKRCL